MWRLFGIHHAVLNGITLQVSTHVRNNNLPYYRPLQCKQSSTWGMLCSKMSNPAPLPSQLFNTHAAVNTIHTSHYMLFTAVLESADTPYSHLHSVFTAFFSSDKTLNRTPASY